MKPTIILIALVAGEVLQGVEGLTHTQVDLIQRSDDRRIGPAARHRHFHRLDAHR